MDELNVQRILRSTTIFDTLRIHPKNLDKNSLRKQFILLARQVHPDKNSSKGAEAAFKKLHESYEKLLLSVDNIKDSKEREKLSRKQSKSGCSEKKESPVSPNDINSQNSSSIPQKPIRVRSWSSFMKVWNEAELNFKKENSETTRRFRYKRTRREATLTNVIDLDDDYLEDVDRRASDWRDFSKIANEDNISNIHTKAENSTEDEKGKFTSSDNIRQTLENSSQNNIISKDNICWLCRRKFKSIDFLRQHEVMSAIHQVNLAMRL